MRYVYVVIRMVHAENCEFSAVSINALSGPEELDSLGRLARQLHSQVTELLYIGLSLHRNGREFTECVWPTVSV